MPTLAVSSKIRAVSEGCSLVLNARHRFVAGDPSEKLYIMKQSRIPDNIDVLTANLMLILTVAGVLDRVKVSHEDMIKSAVVHHLVNYLRTNATELGLSTVSDIYIDDNESLPKIRLSLDLRLPANTKILPPHVTLLGIDLNYSWQTTRCAAESMPTSILSHPFSSHLHLPSEIILNNVLDRFATWQLVRRYPLIFGPWCKKLNIETPFFPLIARSIINMMERSRNPSFGVRCKQLLRIIQRHFATTFSVSLSSLSAYLQSVQEMSALQHETTEFRLTDEEALCLSLEYFYRKGVRRPKFKGSIGHGISFFELGDNEDLPQDFSAHLPKYPVLPEDSVVWSVPVPTRVDLASPHSSPFLKPSVSMELDFDCGFDDPIISSDLDTDDWDAEEPRHKYEDGHLVWTDSNSSPMSVDDQNYFNPTFISLPASPKKPSSPVLDDKEKLNLSKLLRPDQRPQCLLVDIEEQGTDPDHVDARESPDIDNSEECRYSHGRERMLGPESRSQKTATHYLASHSPATLDAAICSTIGQGPEVQEQDSRSANSQVLFRPAPFVVRMNTGDECLPVTHQYIDHVQNFRDPDSRYDFEVPCDTDSDVLDFDAEITIPEAVIFSGRNSSHQVHTLADTCPVNIRIDHQHPKPKHANVNRRAGLGITDEDTLHWGTDTKPEACVHATEGHEEWDDDDGLLLVDFEDMEGDGY